jgi:prolyl-tRNA editing enzyme YbaK/EbsC (Cys-tRNA(Pro) deacylase)
MSKREFRSYGALERPDLLADAVWRTLERWPGQTPAAEFEVIEIDPQFSDTEAFCEHYGIAPDQTANTVIVEARRGGESKLAVVVMSAGGRADLNGVVRKALGARTLSLAAKDAAVAKSAMEYGSITAIGLPSEWPLVVDSRVLEVPKLVMGGGLRRSKLYFPGRALAELPNAMVIENMAKL